MKSKNEIKEKIEELEKRYEYLNDFLETIYKNNNPKERIKKELIIFSREINVLNWVLDIDKDLPF